MGRPKALVELHGEPLVRRALRVLADGGCAPLVVVVGAAAADVRAVLPDRVLVVETPDWAEGMGASLCAGLAVLSGVSDLGADLGAALVHLVDLPGVTSAAVARLLAGGTGPAVLRRAAYDGHPAHPVLLGRDHWAAAAAGAEGDAGARAYLRGNPAVELVECADVASPDDVDTPESLARFTDHSSR
jgi:nicotine blue oxidoreductase